MYDQASGKTLRGTFIIDPQGYIHGMELLIKTVGRCTEEILRQLKAFQNDVSTVEVVPCDWQPGDKTIARSLESVGRIWERWQPASA